MASSKIEQQIYNIFEPNITESISAEDLQLFTNAIFQSSESIIRKFKTPQDLDIFRNSNPDVPMYKNDLVILTEEDKGIYICSIDLPFFSDLVIVANDLTNLELKDLSNVEVTTSAFGDSLMYDGINWVNQHALYGDSINRPQTPTPGMMFFDASLNKPIWYNYREIAWVDSTGKKV